MKPEDQSPAVIGQSSRAIPSTGQEFIQIIRTILGDPLDLRFDCLSNGRITLVYLASIINLGDLQSNIIAPLSGLSLQNINDKNSRPGLDWDRVLPLIHERGQLERHIMDEVIQDLITGRTIIHLEGTPQVRTFETCGGVKRQPTDPNVERTIQGPRISFVENFMDNISMIRSLARDPSMRADLMQIGKRSKTNVAVIYLTSVTNSRIVAEVYRRLAQIEIDDVLSSGYLEQLITDNRWSVFPLTQNTERPDKVVAGIMEGRVAIVVDGSSHAIIVPTTVNELYQSPEDYYWGFWFGSFLRFFRILGNNLAVALPGLYIALVGVNPELLPINFALSISGSRMGVAFPLIIELLVIEITIEIFREASLRLPVTISQTLGVTTGIVLGIASVGAGLVSNATLVIVVVTAIASYSGPDYGIGLSWRILKYVLIIAAAFMGMVGLVTMGLIILGHAAMQNSFGVGYLSPWSPIRLRDLADTIIRKPIWQRHRTGIYLPTDAVRYRKKGEEDHD